MAELFLAQDTTRQKLVVLKRILPYLAHEEEFVQMFLDEARIASLLDHDNVVRVHELGNLEGSIYIAMEFVDGVDLRNILQEEAKRGGHVPYGVAAFVAARLCAGLHYAHTAKDLQGQPLKIVHRDVSPQNVMVAYDAQVKLVDFGIAKAGAFVERSKPGVIKGKFLYLAPEQLTGEPIDHRADIFAVGTLLYEITTGRSPFQKPTTEAVIYAVRSEEPPAPYLVRADFPRELARIIGRCMMKDRDRRYGSAADVQADLQRFLRLTLRTQPQEVSQYISELFGGDDERTKLHIPRPKLEAEIAQLRAEIAAEARPAGVGKRPTPTSGPASTVPRRAEPPSSDEHTALSGPPRAVVHTKRKAPPPVLESPSAGGSPARSTRPGPPVPEASSSAGAAGAVPSPASRRKGKQPSGDASGDAPHARPPPTPPASSNSGPALRTELASVPLGDPSLSTDATGRRLDPDITDSHDVRRLLPSGPADTLTAAKPLFTLSPKRVRVVAAVAGVLLLAGLGLWAASRRPTVPSPGVAAPTPEASAPEAEAGPSARPEPPGDVPELPSPAVAPAGRVDVRFEAPEGTLISADAQRFQPGERYALAPGVLRYRFICPGRKLQVFTQVELSAGGTSPQILAIDCGRP